MTTFMLDTNIVAHFLRKNRQVAARLADALPNSVCVSAVTEGEIRFGLVKRSNAERQAAVEALLDTIEVLPWTRTAAAVYGRLRADLEARGHPLAPLDMMIAAHAVEAGATLVTADRALLSAPGLTAENWLA